MEEKITIYSYQKVWKVEKKIYSLMNLILPAPVNPIEMGCFFGVLLFKIMVCKVFPLFSGVPGVIRIIVFPYLITKYLMKKKLDGKNPFLFLVGYIRYLLWNRGTYVEGWKRHKERTTVKRLDWYCSRGRSYNESVSD